MQTTAACAAFPEHRGGWGSVLVVRPPAPPTLPFHRELPFAVLKHFIARDNVPRTFEEKVVRNRPRNAQKPADECPEQARGRRRWRRRPWPWPGGCPKLNRVAIRVPRRVPRSRGRRRRCTARIVAAVEQRGPHVQRNVRDGTRRALHCRKPVAALVPPTIASARACAIVATSAAMAAATAAAPAASSPAISDFRARGVCHYTRQCFKVARPL